MKILKDRLGVIFLVAVLLSGLLAVYGLRDNNLTMINLRDSVYRADQQNGDVESALRELRVHIYSHMNTDPGSGSNSIRPPIQLKYRYERLVSAEKQRIAEANTKVYTDAQIFCEQQNPASVSGRSRVPCIEDYVARNGIKEQQIPEALYKFDFVSPIWSPDLAGWSLLTFAIAGVLLIGRVIVLKFSSATGNS